MGKLIDLTGKRFGSLVVKERDGKDKHGHAMWLCECDCGNFITIRGDSLTRGTSTSCGCKQREQFDEEIQKLVGKKFGKLTVISRAENYISPKGKTHTMLNCRCDCGNEIVAEKYHVVNNVIQSCGCLQKEVTSARATKHGMYGSHIYNVWDNMIGRCYRDSNQRYNIYGGRGIKVCDEWKQFKNFYEYVSKLPHYNEDGYTLDRIDNNGNYEPNNVRWADGTTQANNTSRNHRVTFNGKTQTIAQWSREYDIPYKTFSERISRGWSIDRALTTK